MVLGGVAFVACGWLLSLSGDYDAGLLRWHKWTGITTVSLFVGAGLLYWLDLKKPYRLCVFSSVAVLALASHLGGSLTHGRDYLVRYAPGPLRHWLAPSAASGPAPAGAFDPLELHVLLAGLTLALTGASLGLSIRRSGIALENELAQLEMITGKQCL